MANPDFTGSLTYSGSETFIIPPENRYYNPSSGGVEHVVYTPALQNPAGNLYTITVTDANTGSITIQESGGANSPATQYIGSFTGYTTGGDYSVTTSSTIGPNGQSVADSKYWLFLHAPPPSGFTSENVGLDSLSYYAGDFVPPCYAAGTRILTTRGEIEVEALQVGDVVVTHAGSTRPVVWIGHRSVDPARMATPDDYRPIRIRAHAFGPDRPHRDLRVSPDHAVAVDHLLIPARNLLNGATIVRDGAEPVTYYHVELDRHALLIAEGLAAESYLDTGNRGSFVNGGPATRLHPDLARKLWDQGACAPIVDRGVAVDAARRRLIAAAKVQGFATTTDPAALLVIDGVPMAPSAADGDTLTFVIPAGTPRDIRLQTRSCAPAWTAGTADFRPLGIAIGRIELRGPDRAMTISSGADLFSTGFHDVESDGTGTWRWTNGDAVFPAAIFAAFGGGCELTLTLLGSLEYWLADTATVRSESGYRRTG